MIAPVDTRDILSKTAKGLAETTGRTNHLSRAQRNLLKGIDGRIPIADLAGKFNGFSEAQLIETLEALEQQGFVRRLPSTGEAAPEHASGEAEELDFTAGSDDAVVDAADYFAARRAAIERAKAEETAKARAEGEAAARAEAEAAAAQRAKADAEAAAIAEAKRAEAAARVRIHHETKTKQATEAKARAEAEAAELRRKLDEERQAREELERKADEAPARGDDDERAQEISRRFQEEQARRAAERQAQREEAERKRAQEEAERLEHARAAEEAKKARQREEDERQRAAAEAERLREEQQARARAETLEQVRVAAATAMLARKQADEEAALINGSPRREIAAGPRQAEPAVRAPRRAHSRGRIAAVLFLLSAGTAATAYFMRLDAASFEREATARLGTPVRIGSAHFALLPLPALKFERVSIGPAGEIKIATVSSRRGAGAIFDQRSALRYLELDGVQMPVSWAGAAIWAKGTADAWPVDRLIARGLKIEAPGLELPVLTVDAKFASGGALQSFLAESADRSQTFTLTMMDGKAAVDIAARNFQLPFPGAVPLGDLSASGTLSPSELALGKFDLQAFGGSVKGNARLRWGARWSVEGEFTAASMNPRLATASLVATGRLEGKGRFSMRAPAPHKLHEAARVDATFTVRNGSLGFVDLTRALQAGNARGGTTSFASLDGSASFADGTVRVAQLRLAAGLLNATGDATVDAAGNLIGRLHVDLTSQSRGVMTLGGTVAEPHARTTR